MKIKKKLAYFIISIAFILPYIYVCWFIPIVDYRYTWYIKVLIHHGVLGLIIGIISLLVWADVTIRKND
jgi:hypothetical protein